MAVFNGEQYLAEAIDSILYQTYANFELIIIDDGSTDNSSSIVNSYSDGRIKYIYQCNLGLPAALNHGLGIATGQLICRMDADDISLSSRLEEQVDFMKNNPDCGILGGQAYLIDAQGNEIGQKLKPIDYTTISKAIIWGCPVIHPTYLVRDDVYKKLSGYRESIIYAEDYDFLLRAYGQGYVINNLKSFLIKYRISDSQKRLGKERLQMLQTRLILRLYHERRHTGSEPISILEQLANTSPKPNRWFDFWLGARNKLLYSKKNEKNKIKILCTNILVMLVSLMDRELFLATYRAFRYKQACNET